MVPTWADQLLLQLLMEKFDTLPIQCRHIEPMHEGVWFRKINFDKMTWADQLLPQLLMEQFDTLPIQYRHIKNMHEGVWLKIFFFDKMTAMRT